MPEILYQEVNFNTYCDLCKNKDVPETEEPCNECLSEPTNLYSTKPINFEERDK